MVKGHLFRCESTLIVRIFDPWKGPASVSGQEVSTILCQLKTLGPDKDCDDLWYRPCIRHALPTKLHRTAGTEGLVTNTL